MGQASKQPHEKPIKALSMAQKLKVGYSVPNVVC